MSVPSFSPESPYSFEIPYARRPGGLTAVCVFAIILGGLGLLGSLMALVSLAVGPRLQQALQISPQGPGQDRSIELQRTMQRRIQAVSDRYRWPNAGFALLNVGLAGCMLAGGIMALNRAARARRLLIAVFAVAILFEISRSIVQACMQWEMANVMSNLLPRMMERSAPANGPNAPNAAAVATAIAKMGMVLGLAFTVAFSLAKLIYYAVGWCYLRRPAVCHWFDGANAQSPAADGGEA